MADKTKMQPSDLALIFYYKSEENMNKAYEAISKRLSCYHLERRVVRSRRVLYPYWVVCAMSDEESVYGLLGSVGLNAMETERPFYYTVLDESSPYSRSKD